MRYANWQLVPSGLWIWPNFSPKEIACHHCGEIIVDVSFLDRLQRMRDYLGLPMRVSNGYRCRVHNARVGGAPGSMHKVGKAGDIVLERFDRRHLVRAAENVGFSGLGFYNTFLHVDIGRRRSWGNEEMWRCLSS